MTREILRQLRKHIPFTAVGTASGIVIMVVMSLGDVPRDVSEMLFWGLHPLHVLVSALVTAAMYRLHAPGSLWRTVLIGYIGSVGIATLSDSLIPFLGEWLIGLPNRGMHIGFIEKWWLVNPLALFGVAIGMAWPHTRFPHAIHVFLSTWASLFHMIMAMGGMVDLSTIGSIALFLFLAVWVPCCTSDIAFPLLWVTEGKGAAGDGGGHRSGAIR